MVDGPIAPELPLGAELRFLRARLGFGLNEAAGRSEISKAALSQWESGLRVPSGQALDRLLVILKVDPRSRARILTAADPGYARSALATEPLGPVVDIAQILRGMRLRSGMTQVELAGFCSVRQSSVADWEAGQTVPNPESLQRALLALNASQEEIEAINKCRIVNAGTGIKGDLTERMLAIHSSDIPLAIREPYLLLVQRDAWIHASRDAAFDEILCETIAWRGAWYRSQHRQDECVQQLRHALRLAKATENYDLAVLAAIYLSNLQAFLDYTLAPRLYKSLIKYRDKPMSNLRKAHLLHRCAVLASGMVYLDRSWIGVSEELAKESLALFGDQRSGSFCYPYVGAHEPISLLAYIEMSHRGRPERAIEILKLAPGYDEYGFLTKDIACTSDAYLFALWWAEEDFPPESIPIAQHFASKLPQEDALVWKEWLVEIPRRAAGLPTTFVNV